MTATVYDALVGPGLVFAGVDQGIDFTGKGEVKALGPGTITRDVKGGSGWPGQGAVLVERITGGPEKGRSVYVAEDFAADPALRVGSRVAAGQVLGEATGSGLAPGIEVGWATPLGLPVAPRPPARPAPQWTPEGQSFDNYVQAVGGSQGGDVHGGPSAGDVLGGIAVTGALNTATGGLGGAVADAAAGGVGNVVDKAGNLINPTKWVGELTTWLGAKGKLILAYVLLVGVAGALFVTGLKGLGVPIPKVAPVPVP